MNKYIKKCLIVYASLALILVGMAGAAYAVTASDADQYVTRSQFATDMAYLQSQLDDQETGLMGNINRYRSTNILLSTWDSPNLQTLSGNIGAGYHNGGNVFPKPIYNTSNWHYTTGWYSSNQDWIKASNNPLFMFRLWNGNYYLTHNIQYRENKDVSVSATEHRGMVKCAVPVENFPGWYIVLSAYTSVWAGMAWYACLVKLDPNVPYPANYNDLKNADLRIRFKKDLWTKIYAGRKMPTSSTPVTYTFTSNFYNDMACGPFTSSYRSSWSAAGSENLYLSSWLEEETGDYIQTIRGMLPYFPSTAYRTYNLYVNDQAGGVISGLIPSDNVEYMMGPIQSGTANEMGENTGNINVNTFPSPRYIGVPNMYSNDAFDIEIVDGVNGIKYWHCYKRPSKETINSTHMNTIMGWHYSLPIVY